MWLLIAPGSSAGGRTARACTTVRSLPRRSREDSSCYLLPFAPIHRACCRFCHGGFLLAAYGRTGGFLLAAYGRTALAPRAYPSASTTMQDVEYMHKVLCGAGATTMLRYQKHYHGTGFGKASMAEVRNFRCPIKVLMQGDANLKRRRTHDAQTESTMSMRVVQISRRKASSSLPQDHGLHFADQHPSHQSSSRRGRESSVY